MQNKTTVFDEFKNYDSWVRDEEGRPSKYAAHQASANKDNDWFQCKLLSFGDYDNSCHVERSNVRVFMEMFKDDPNVIKINGAYSSESIYINGLCDNEEIIETLTALYNYPCIDEDDCSEVEQELIQEAWNSFGERDFLDLIQKKFSADDIEVKEGNDLWSIYKEAAEETNTYEEIESGGNVYFDFKRVIDAECITQDLFNIEIYE